MHSTKAESESLSKLSDQNIDVEKQKLRTYISHCKRDNPEGQKAIDAKKVFDKIEEMIEFKNSKTIMLYWSMPDELPTHNFIQKWCEQKQILLPVVKNDEMLIKTFSSQNELKKSSYGIWEPHAQEEFSSSIDLVIAPGVAFDKNKNRLGRGKAYYDQFFMKTKAIRIGVGFDFQLVDEVPTNQFDVQLDKVITPSSTIE